MTEKTPQKQEGVAVKEQVGTPVKFYVGEKGLQTAIYDFMTEEEFLSQDDDDFEPNVNWQAITVANKADMEKWVDLKNAWLGAAWAPNQNPDTRNENVQKMKDLEEKMEELESKAKTGNATE